MPNMMKPRPKDSPIVLPPHRPPKRTRRKMKEQRFWLVHITNPAYRPKIKALKTWLAPITFKKSITIHQRRQWNKLFLTISLKTERVKILWEVVNIVKLFGDQILDVRYHRKLILLARQNVKIAPSKRTSIHPLVTWQQTIAGVRVCKTLVCLWLKTFFNISISMMVMEWLFDILHGS